MDYFSDRERGGSRPQTETELTPGFWRGIAALIKKRFADNSFGARFPEKCPDGTVPCGVNDKLFWDTITAEIPSLVGGKSILNEEEAPPLLVVMDMIEFCWRSVGKVEQGDYHKFHRHHHLGFDKEAGRSEFRDEVNRIFRRKGLAYELTEKGQIERLIPREIGDALIWTHFQTGDAVLDKMLETARQRFLGPDERRRCEALEKLWDAWERIKTLNGADKKSGITALLDKTAGARNTQFRKVLEDEARNLTAVGNRFQIRHSETTQKRLNNANHVDYLFHRLFSLIFLILRMTERTSEIRSEKDWFEAMTQSFH